MPASSDMFTDFSSSANDLIAALAEMDAIIAESKISLDNMSTSSSSSSKRDDGKSPVHQFPSLTTEEAEINSKHRKHTNGHHLDIPTGHRSFEDVFLANTSRTRKAEPQSRYCYFTDSTSVMAQLAEEMRLQIELTDGLAGKSGSGKAALQLNNHTLTVLKKWINRQCASEILDEAGSDGGGCAAVTVERMADAVKRAEAERDNLQNQLTLIFEQTQTQREKIHELQDLLMDKTMQLESSEDLLKEEMLTRSQLETNKLDLVTEMEDMRVRMLTSGNGTYMNGVPNGGYTTGSLKRVNGASENMNGYVRKSPTADMQLLRNELEQEKMRKTVQLLTAKLEEKDRRIQQLEEALRIHSIRESDILTRTADSSARCEDSRDGGRKPPAVIRPSTASNQRKTYQSHAHYSPFNNDAGSNESLPRFDESCGNGVSVSNSGETRRRESSSRSAGGDIGAGRAPRSRSTDARLARSCGEKQQLHPYQDTRQLGSFRVSPLPSSKSLGEKLSGASMSSSLSFLRQRSLSHGAGRDEQEVNRCSSVPNLNGRIGSHESDQFRTSTPKSGFSDEKKHSLRKFFEKFTRSGSPQLEEIIETKQQFKRGGTRSTAGPRLQHAGSSVRRKWDINSPVKDWTPEMSIQWLEEDVQIPVPHGGQAWLRTGHQLANVTAAEMEKELGITHPLHRKKLQLALKSKAECDSHPMGKVDYLLILRWLDDIGLPQYKDAFADARIDGRTLNFLTTDDLFLLKVTSALHQSSIRTGIQVLRECDFDLRKIQKRALPNSVEVATQTPSSVLYWNSQRVLEWIQFLDLAEYRPCLRGSGVHGGLMVLEDRFNAELLAELLSIPQSKTLLRRHLSKSFTELLGGELVRRKRAKEAAPGFVSLSPQLKLKPVRRAFSLVRKRSKSDHETPDYVCPLELAIDHTAFESPVHPRDVASLFREDSYHSQLRNEASCSLNSLPLTTV